MIESLEPRDAIKAGAPTAATRAGPAAQGRVPVCRPVLSEPNPGDHLWTAAVGFVVIGV
jgi:hypothetical protein